ncbi:MAG: tyrosine-type recombinase/integrase [Halobacteriovoraceae bacterium]|nr:tyrosine-type recombinase/integrase [Halobacteriovoraceae bacterium]
MTYKKFSLYVFFVFHHNVNMALEIQEEFLDNFLSKHTRVSYKTDLDQFCRFLMRFSPEIKDLAQVNRHQVILFRNYLQIQKNYTPKTISRKLAAISSYYDFIVEKGLMNTNPSLSVKRPRKEVVNPTPALLKEQVLQLFSAVSENRRSGPLHRALLITFFTTGLRKSEIIYLKRKNFRQMNGSYFISYCGKGGKRGLKLLHPLCVEAIISYMEWMEQQGRKHKPSDWLFRPTRNPLYPGNLDKPLNPKTINEIFNHYGKKIGLSHSISPHCARATFISTLLENGVDIYKVAQEVNHSSVKTTQEYDKRRRKIKDSPINKLNY